MTEITTESDGETYADIRVDGQCVASVDLRANTDDREVSVKTFDPRFPEDAHHEDVFEWGEE